MSSKGAKRPKGRKEKAGEPGVMGSLPTTRPARIGGRREASPAADGAAPAAPKKRTKPPTKDAPKSKPKPTAAAAPAPARAGTPSSPKATAPTPPKTTPPPAKATAPTPPATGLPPTPPTPDAEASSRRDQPPVREPAGEDRVASGGIQSTGTELVGSVVKAAGDLAHIGLTVGGQVLKTAVRRLPRP